MAEPVGSLRVDLAANVAAFQADMAAARTAVNTTAVSMQRSMLAASKGIGAAGGSLLSLRNAAIVTGAVMAVALIKRSIQYADSLSDMAQRVGMNVESFQELAYAAKLAGVEQEDFGKAMEQMVKRLGEVTGGVTNAQKSLAKLGLSITDIRGKSPEESFRLIADRISKIPNSMEQAALATEFFSRAGVKLIPMLKLGAAGFVALAAEARKMGLILSADVIKKAADADDELDRIGMAAKVAGVNISVGFLPALTEIRRIVTSPEFQESVKALAKWFSDIAIWSVNNKETLAGVAAALAAFKAVPGPPLVKAAAAVVAFGVASNAATPEIKQLENDIENLVLRMNHWRIASENTAFKPLGLDPKQELKKLELEYAALEKRLAALRKAQAEPTARVRETPQITVGPLVSDEVKEKLADLQFQTQLTRGEFDGLAEGFPQVAHALKLFGTQTHAAVTSAAELTYQLKMVNAAQMKLQGAKLTKEMQGPLAKYNEDVAKLKLLLDAGAISQDVFNKKVQQLAFPSLSAYVEDTKNLNKQLDTLATGGLNDVGTALLDFQTGAKTGAEAMKELEKQVIRSILKMINEMLILQPIAAALKSLLGGWMMPSFGGMGADAGASSAFDFGGGRAVGGPVSAGVAYEVGERGRELFLPNMDGRIIPNSELRGAGGGDISVPIVVNLDARGADQNAVMRAVQELKAQIPNMAVQAVQSANSRRVMGL